MHAKCGSIVRHHWAHLTNKDCDSWAESISPWHAAWQDCFPPECQEVWLGDNNEHRADVKGEIRILEVQKSPLSPEKITEREKFYGDMAWMLCGEDFESNFQLFSLQDHRKGRLCFSFRWKRMRTSWLAATKPIFIHFSKGIGLLRELHEDGRGIIEFFAARRFANGIDSRFNPSPLYLDGGGFEPLIEGFVEQCCSSDAACAAALQEHEDHALAANGRWNEASGMGCLWDVESACTTLKLKYSGLKRRLIADLLDSFRCTFAAESKAYSDNPEFKFSKENTCCDSLFLTQENIEEVKSFESKCLYSVGLCNFYVDCLDETAELYKLASDELGGHVIELAEEYKLSLKRKAQNESFIFRFKIFKSIVTPLIAVTKERFFEYSVLYGLQCLYLQRNQSQAWGQSFLYPDLADFKGMFSLMPEEFKANVRSSIDEIWTKSERERKLLERKADDDRQRWELQQRHVTEQALRERLSWPLEKVANCLADAVNGELVGEYSLAEAFAMNPGASWADQVDEGELLAARSRLKNFDPASIYRL